MFPAPNKQASSGEAPLREPLVSTAIGVHSSPNQFYENPSYPTLSSERFESSQTHMATIGAIIAAAVVSVMLGFVSAYAVHIIYWRGHARDLVDVENSFDDVDYSRSHTLHSTNSQAR